MYAFVCVSLRFVKDGLSPIQRAWIFVGFPLLMPRATDPEDLDDEGGDLYSKTVSIRLSEAQIAGIKRLAKHVGVKPGTLMRIELLKNIDWERWVPTPKSQEKPPPEKK